MYAFRLEDETQQVQINAGGYGQYAAVPLAGSSQQGGSGSSQRPPASQKCVWVARLREAAGGRSAAAESHQACPPSTRSTPSSPPSFSRRRPLTPRRRVTGYLESMPPPSGVQGAEERAAAGELARRSRLNAPRSARRPTPAVARIAAVRRRGVACLASLLPPAERLGAAVNGSAGGRPALAAAPLGGCAARRRGLGACSPRFGAAAARCARPPHLAVATKPARRSAQHPSQPRGRGQPDFAASYASQARIAPGRRVSSTRLS